MRHWEDFIDMLEVMSAIRIMCVLGAIIIAMSVSGCDWNKTTDTGKKTTTGALVCRTSSPYKASGYALSLQVCRQGRLIKSIGRGAGTSDGAILQWTGLNTRGEAIGTLSIADSLILRVTQRTDGSFTSQINPDYPPAPKD